MSKFGVPHNIIRIVEKLYMEFKMKLKIGKISTIIEYLTGVKQGDVLAPTLFLFPMQTMAECVLQKWKEEGIEPFTYLFDESSESGKMVRHRVTKKNTILPPSITVAEIILILYVDNGALCFHMYKEMIG